MRSLRQMKFVVGLLIIFGTAFAGAQSSKVAHGYRIVGVEPNSLYAKLGLKPGDILKKIDGKPVTGPADVDGLLLKLKKSNRIDFLIERAGKEQTMTFTAK